MEMGIELEQELFNMWSPHKVKLAVSGCPRNCAEAGIKDVGVIGVDSGWELYVGGNGGIKTEVAQFFVKVKTAEEVREYSGAFLQLYREEAFYLERTVHYLQRVGMDHAKKRVLDDEVQPQGAVSAAAVFAVGGTGSMDGTRQRGCGETRIPVTELA
jgi:nitrite reductase (NADH) large subunit